MKGAINLSDFNIGVDAYQAQQPCWNIVWARVDCQFSLIGLQFQWSYCAAYFAAMTHRGKSLGPYFFFGFPSHV